MRIGFIITLVWLGLLVGGVLLQIFLSRRESRWPGLVLPELLVLPGLLQCRIQRLLLRLLHMLYH